ncbi:MAG: hypothetical protein HN826_15720 [Methylococcales bacterium]|nr:hypothetical protein [Methylococcales bacterium]
MAGVCIAISPISLVISEKLKPLREFFLILFFFAVGANFDFGLASEVVISGLIIGATVIILKPYVFEKAFLQSGESPLISKELSLRLGQGSEFALFIAYTALHNGQIIKQTSSVIQVVVLLSFIFSTYIVMSNYDSPISADSSERRD